MKGEDNRDDLLRLYRDGSYEEVPLGRLERVLMKVGITRIPGAPGDVAGMVYWQGRLIVVYGPKTQADNEDAGCLALIKGEDGRVYGMMADEVAGGEALDTLY